MKRMTIEKCQRVCVDRIEISCLFLKGLQFIALYWALYYLYYCDAIGAIISDAK